MTEIQRHEKIAGIWSKVILLGGSVAVGTMFAYMVLIGG